MREPRDGLRLDREPAVLAAVVVLGTIAIVLRRTSASNLPGLHDGLAQLAALAPGRRADVAPALAGAFGTTFWIAAGLIAATLIPGPPLPSPQQRSHGAQAAARMGSEAAR
jgi:hypothetical protein